MSLFLLGTLFMKPAAAQDAGDTTALLLRPHLVKINLTALPLRTFSFQYEHVMGPRITVGGGLRIMPKGGLPLLNSFEKLIADEETIGHLQAVSISTIETGSASGRERGCRYVYLSVVVVALRKNKK